MAAVTVSSPMAICTYWMFQDVELNDDDAHEMANAAIFSSASPAPSSAVVGMVEFAFMFATELFQTYPVLQIRGNTSRLMSSALMMSPIHKSTFDDEADCRPIFDTSCIKIITAVMTWNGHPLTDVSSDSPECRHYFWRCRYCGSGATHRLDDADSFVFGACLLALSARACLWVEGVRRNGFRRVAGGLPAAAISHAACESGRSIVISKSRIGRSIL